MALRLAVESGDPNIIEKVFKQMLGITVNQKPAEHKIKDVVIKALSIQDGLRHLRNFAKKSGYTMILKKMLELAEG